MRLFVAVPLPEPVRADLDRFLAPRREAPGGPRWADPEQWHLTLAFMASVEPWRADRLTERLADVAGRHPRLPLALAGGGAFPDAGAARVLWAGVADPVNGLGRLAASVRGACNDEGARPGGPRFHPHVTLARFGRPADATRWLRVLATYAGPAWTATRLTLVESHLAQGGGHRPRHVEVAAHPLAGTGGPTLFPAPPP